MLQNPKYNMSYISNFLAIRNAANANPSLPQSQILNAQHTNNAIETDCELDETQLEKLSASSAGKSFTIASILGFKKKNAPGNLDATNQKPKELNAMNLSIHNNQNFQMHNKPFEADNRLLHNRIPLFHHHHHHHLQGSHAHPQTSHFYQPTANPNNNNNNNNNSTTANHNGTSSALQSLQQQFHVKNGPNFRPFHGKEQRNKNGTIQMNLIATITLCAPFECTLLF